MANPLLSRWSGPHGGVPPFDKVTVEHFKPALEAAMEEHLAEIDRIAGDPAPPNFDNTIAALERAGRTFDRARRIYSVFSTTLRSPAFQQVEREMEPKMAAFRDRILQNAKLFERISAVYAARASSQLTPEQQRLVWLKYTDFARGGARLDPGAKKRLSEINQRLASLYTQFSQNVLADESTALILDSAADLAGLPESLRSAAAEAAVQRGRPGKWAILNTRSSMEPFLAYSESRDLRERVWRAYYSRGDNGDARDNKKIIAEIVSLRGERAKLLGYPSHAHWRLEMSMAKTPERATELMEAVWRPAVTRVVEEVADMQAEADREVAGLSGSVTPRIEIEPWDYRY